MMPGTHRTIKTFANLHAKDVIVHAPAQPDQIGLEAHTEFALNFFEKFPDQHVENGPYKVFFTSGENLGVRVHGQKKAD
ncbi:MAG: ester cyclase [Methanosarcinaceae archaeon]|nr:ester cyclase [Methanosarcinaceae archaeon]